MELDTPTIIQIMEHNNLRATMPEDTFGFFLHSFKNGVPSQIKQVFQQFTENNDQTSLLEKVKEIGETMLQ